jgi:hypothetical protein
VTDRIPLDHLTSDQYEQLLAERDELARKLAVAERLRENADFHLGREMARRQLAERCAEKTEQELAALRQSSEVWASKANDTIQQIRQRAETYRTAWHSARTRARMMSAELTRRAPLNGQYAADWEKQRKRAEQAEELLSIAHQTSNRSEAERTRAVQRADQAEAALARVRKASRRVTSALIAVEPRLTQPYPDDPRWTPWTRFVGPALKELQAALQPGPAGTEATDTQEQQ